MIELLQVYVKRYLELAETLQEVDRLYIQVLGKKGIIRDITRGFKT